MECEAKTKSERPERPVRSVYVTARLTQDERALVDEQASKAGMTVSDWTREAVVQAATGLPLSFRFLAAEVLALRALLVGMQPGQKAYTTKQIDETKAAVALQFWKSFLDRIARDGE